MWKPTLLSWVPRRRSEGGGITPGARTVPAGVLVFDGENKDLWWVKVILNVGRPVVAVIVLVMCAPGEHYLARLAGWSHWLAWGMPATLTAYAGIAAVVATKRPKGSPGKKTAVAGAIISVLLAMGAQPIAHLYEQQLITGHRFALTIVISCIPALVFGHLLHMAAAPVGVPAHDALPDMDPVDHITAAFDIPRDLVTGPVSADEDTGEEDTFPYEDAMRYEPGDEDGTDASIDYLRGVPPGYRPAPVHSGQDLEDINLPAPVYSGEDLQDILRQVDVSPRDTDMWTAPVGTPEPRGPVVPGTWRGHQPNLVLVDDVPPADNRRDNEEDIDQGQTTVSGPVPGHRDTDTGDRGTGRDRPRSVPSRRNSGTGITSRVRDILRDNPGATDEQIKDMFDPGVSRNSIGKSIKRVRN